jgi:adenosylmethionine-8-amino-7-oxononanoate aminotransferase
MNADRIWHPYTRLSAEPETGWPVIARGEGIHLFDEAGRAYVDAISSWWACALGHAHPRLVAAIARQAAILPHSILGNLSHRPALDLAAALCGLMPTPDRHVHFASDGASAVEAALKIAVQYGHNIGRPGRRGLVSLEGAYHGDTLGAMAVGYQPGFHTPFRDLLFHAHRIQVPASAGQEDACLREAGDWLGRHAAETAALIVEPLCQGAAGMRMHSARFLKELASLCERNGILLIADEVAVGFGRTGRWFAFEHAGIDPDLVCVGKALSGGSLPISAVIVRDSIYRTFSDVPSDHTLYHGHTFAGNPIACAASLEALRIYREDGWIERVARLGGILCDRMRPLSDLPSVLEIRTLGLIGAVELKPDSGPVETARPVRVREALLRRGVLSRPLGSVVYLMPPLIITEPELEQLVQDLIASVQEAG